MGFGGTLIEPSRIGFKYEGRPSWGSSGYQPDLLIFYGSGITFPKPAVDCATAEWRMKPADQEAAQ